MELNEEERKEIEGAAERSPAVERLYNEWKSYQGDGGKEFYKSLLNTTRALSAELESVSTGSYNKKRILSSDSKEWKRIFSLLVNSKKILAGLNQNEEVESGTTKIINKSKQKEEAEDIPLTDRLANTKSK